MVLMLMRFLLVCLMPPSFGLMVEWFWTRSLVFLLLVLGCFAHQSELCWSDRRWGHVDRVQSGGVAHSCRGFVSVPGPLQTVQRAESLEESFLLFSLLMLFTSQLTILVLFGMLDVCLMVALLLPFLSLLLMMIFLSFFAEMIDHRGRGTVRVTEVKDHADEGMVSDGRVRELDRLGNNAADEAADFGRRSVGPAVVDARRYLSGVCGRWYLCSS